MVITPGTTRGGDRWAITGVAGIRITDGARGAGPPSPMSTASGVTRHTLAPVPPGRIRTLAITAQPAAARITTPRPDELSSPAAARTPTSIPAIQPAIAEARPTTPTLASLQVAAPDTPAISTPDWALRIAAVLSTTPTPTPELPQERTTSMPAKTVQSTATTVTPAVG